MQFGRNRGRWGTLPESAECYIVRMTTGGLLRRQLIRRKLAQRPGLDAKTSARIAGETWNRVVSHIAPVIGEEGVRALYERAFHLTRPTFPWLAEVQKPAEKQQPFLELQRRLEERRAPEVCEISSALLITFTELLASLIGEDLTTRLTHAAWDSEPPSDKTNEESKT